MKSFGDSQATYEPRETMEYTLIDKKIDDNIKKALESEHQFFDNDIASQVGSSITLLPQNSGSSNRGITWNIPALEQAYRSSPYLKRAIQWNASNLFIKGIDINLNDNTLTSRQLGRIQNVISMIRYRQLKKMAEYGFLYGGSALLKVVRGKTRESDFFEPFLRNKVNKGDFLGLKPLTRWYMIEPALDKGLVSEVEPEKGIYSADEIGLPLYYRVNFSGGLSGLSGLNQNEIRNKGLKIQGNNILVHRSWLYIFNPYPLGHIETQVERYWSESMMEVAKKDLDRHEIIWTATAKSAVKNNMGILKIHGLDNVVQNQRTKKIQNQKIVDIKTGSSQGILALGEKDEFEFASGNIQGNDIAIKQSMRQIALAFRTPENILFNDPSQYNEESYLQILSSVEDMQKSEISPIMEDLIIIESKNQFGKGIGEFSFEFKPILSLTPKAKAEVIDIMVGAIGKAHQEGFIDTATGIEMLPDVLNNTSNIFNHLNEDYVKMIKKGAEDGTPITANWFKIELAKALNQYNNNEQKGTSGVESPESSTGRVNEGGDPTRNDRAIKRHVLNPAKGKVS